MSDFGIQTAVKMLYPLGEHAGEHADTMKKQFGVLNMKIDECSPVVKKLSWVVTVDRSASMNEFCDDGTSKMDHIKHTLLNMLDYFVQFKNIEQTLTLIIFDHEVEILLSQVKICEDLLDSFADLLAKTKPRGQTNIEAALQTASLVPDNDGDRLVHIFMTDGRITCGKTKLDEIKNALVTKKRGKTFSNVFVGYGCDHDAVLLRELGSVSGGDYYFVESLENAGFVYGEIVYNYFYAYIENVVIRVNNGLIYDYVENQWKDTVRIDSLPSGKERTWHLLGTGSASLGTASLGSASLGSASLGSASLGLNVSCEFNVVNNPSSVCISPKVYYPSVAVANADANADADANINHI